MRRMRRWWMMAALAGLGIGLMVLDKKPVQTVDPAWLILQQKQDWPALREAISTRLMRGPLTPGEKTIQARLLLGLGQFEEALRVAESLPKQRG